MQHLPINSNNLHLELFEKHKPTLFVVAYKMTKNVMDAEDILHDIFISFSKQPIQGIQNVESYLVKSVMNRCLTFIEKQKNIQYTGIDLPSPLFNDRFTYVHDQDISYALLLLLHKLNPIERAIFILRETLDYQHDEIAEILAINEENCRQLLHRAKEKMSSNKTRFIPSKEHSEALINAFLYTCASGDVEQLMILMKADIILYSDGGGKVTAALNPIVGNQKCIYFLTKLYTKIKAEIKVEMTSINGENGILFTLNREQILFRLILNKSLIFK
jgi:RNA polymerase sigma-70 factor (ECF subfamily)